MTLLLKTCLPLLKFKAFPWTRMFAIQQEGETKVVGTATTGTACPCVSGWVTLQQQIPEPSFWLFLIQLPFYLPSDNRRRSRDLRSAWTLSVNTHTHTRSSTPCSWIWQGLNLPSCLECVYANCQCALGELVDKAWQPFLKPVCSYIWFIFGFSVFLKRN